MSEGNKNVHPRNISGLIKKTAITTCISLGLTFGVVYADDINLETVFHVYIDGEHVGTVDNQEVIKSYIDQLIKDNQDEYKDYSLTVGEKINYVAEKVFEPVNSNQQVLDVVKDELSVKVNSYEVKIGDKVLGYFKDKETAETTLMNYKAKFVDRQILEQLEEESEKLEQSKLAAGDSNVLDVKLSEEVSISEQKVSPNQIVTVEEGQTLLEKGTLEDKKHEIEEGEVLGSIASKYDLSLDKLLELNPGLTEDTLIQIGDKLNVTDYRPFLDVIVTREEKVEETIPYEREIVESDDMYKGDTKTKQEGQEGKKEVEYKIEKVNGQVVSRDKVEEEVTKEPVKEIIIKGTKVVPSRGSGQFQWPAVGGRITSHLGPRWGRMHKGIDIAGVSNRSILAADNGTVEFAGWGGGSTGNKIVINHNNGYKTLYFHLSSINVRSGQTVTRGSKIGIMGSTGNSTGVHLHFEVYKYGSLVNPANLF